MPRYVSCPIERDEGGSFIDQGTDILEYSNIAWPNPTMWAPAPHTSFKYNPGSVFSEFKEPEDAHAHSPTRHEIRAAAAVGSQASSHAAYYNAWAFRNFPTPLTQWQSNPREPRWPPYEPFMPDPFMDSYVTEGSMFRSGRSSLEDVPMPDYATSSSASSRAISSMTGISYEHSKQPSIVAPIDEEQYNQLIEALSPSKAQASDTNALINSLAAVPPMGSKPSAAAEARSASYARSGSRTSIPSVLKEISQPGTREVSNSSAKSNINIPADGCIDPGVTHKVHPSPSGNIKGRKETISLENKENETAVETPRKAIDKVGDPQPKIVIRTGGIDAPRTSRRKRSGSILGDLEEEISHISKEEIILISPIRPPAQVAVEDHNRSDRLEDFPNSRAQLGGSAVEITEID